MGGLATLLIDLLTPGEEAIDIHTAHLFEEPGALEQVARLARDWFERYLTQAYRQREAGAS